MMSPSNHTGKQRSGRPAQREDLAGCVLRGGEYKIKRVLGHGGMGKVFLASHITLETPLALKQCRADQPLPQSVVDELEQLLHSPSSTPGTYDEWQAEDAGSRSQTGASLDFPSSGGTHTDRFLREALLLARLNHSAIPALYDYFLEDGYWYLVMDYIPGLTLSTYMRRQGALPPLEALNYAIQLCDVLAYLHRQTPPVIFRDLKPSNIILTPDHRLALVDFGIARYFKEGQANDTTDLGSPGYAAPEQYEGESQTDARSDLYSLGIILHEMLSGQRPTRLNQQPEPLHTFNPNLSSVLSGLVTVATRPDPAYRFQSAYTLHSALERIYALEEYHACKQVAFNPDYTPAPGQPTIPGHPRGVALLYTNHYARSASASQRGVGGVYSRTTPRGWPGMDDQPAMEGKMAEERQRIREILAAEHREHHEQQEREQLEQEVTAIDESLHLRAYLGFASGTLPQAKEQEKPVRISRPHRFATRVFRAAQICFICALILFLIMASLLVYTHNIRNLHDSSHSGSVTRGQQVNITPAVTTTPTATWQQLPSPPSSEADNSATYVQLQGKGYIYMNGGFRGPNAVPHYDRGLYRYNIASAHWETLAIDNFPGMVNNAAALDEQGHLFFTAGYSSDTYAVTSLLYEYRPALATVQKITPPASMPIGFGGAMIADQHGHLYITQGFMQAANPNASAGTGWYRYDISTGQWHQLAPLPVGLGYVVLAPDGADNILLLGGSADAGQHRPTMHIYRYSIALNAWSLASTSAPTAFSGAASCLATPGNLVIIGGYDAAHTSSLNTVWLVNLSTLRWTLLTTIPNGGSLLGTAACDGHDHVYLLRGANSPKQPTADFLELTIHN